MVAWLLEFSGGIVVILAGVGLWALPIDTPVVGRPPLFVGWVVVGLGVLIAAGATVRRFRSGYQFQVPIRRRAGRNDRTRAESDSMPQVGPPAPVPFQIPTAAGGNRVFTRVSPADLLELVLTAGLTNAERKLLIAPHVGQWIPIEGTVNNVDATYPSFVVMVIDAGLKAPIFATFNSDLDRARSLRKATPVRIIGKIAGPTVMEHSFTLDDCEFA